MRNPFRKEFKMLWKVEKNKKISYLAGCAHFFPVSYRSSFKTIIRELNPVMFEGPLDEGNMDAVRGLGVVSRNTKSIKEFIDREIQKAIEREISSFYYKEYFKDFIGILKQGKASLFESETDGLSPWMAFFRIWTIFLKNRGWHYSVDLDAHTVAKELGKTVIYLETVEEQIAALEGIPVERIIRFISHFHKWDEFAKNHARLYKKGDLDGIFEITTEFPTRCSSIIEQRDPVLYKRMRDNMEEGNAIAFVGTTHIKGLITIFLNDGFNVSQVS